MPFGDWEKGGLRTVTQLQVFLSAKDAKNISWLWQSLLSQWGSLNMTCFRKFVYIYIYINIYIYISKEVTTDVQHLITRDITIHKKSCI